MDEARYTKGTGKGRASSSMMNSQPDSAYPGREVCQVGRTLSRRVTENEQTRLGEGRK